MINLTDISRQSPETHSKKYRKMNSFSSINVKKRQTTQICKFYQKGWCRFGSRCRNFHPNCQNPKETNQTTSKELVSYSLTKTCGICLELVLHKKDKKSQMFGILPNCNHCFCFACIRRWRRSKDFDCTVSKGCPECRTWSDFVYRSKVWFENRDEKNEFIGKEKSWMQTIDCRYFRKGRGKCPFGNTCLYLHALRDGTKMDVGPPKPCRRQISASAVETELVDYLLIDDENDSFYRLVDLRAAHEQLREILNFDEYLDSEPSNEAVFDFNDLF